MILDRLKHFHFDWKLTALFVVLLPVLLKLGFWQLSREAEKRQIQAQYDARQQEAPRPLGSLDPGGDLQYVQVSLSGRFDNEHVFLLDNSINKGKPGYEVVQPFRDESGRIVLVNRGWIAQGSYRSELPQVEPVKGEVSLRGGVYVPVGKQLILGQEQDSNGWPRVIEALDIKAVAEAAGIDAGKALFPYSVRLDEGSTGVLVRNWMVISVSPERHQAYAVQWFAMALALVLLYLYYSTRPPATQDGPSGEDGPDQDNDKQ